MILYGRDKRLDLLNMRSQLLFLALLSLLAPSVIALTYWVDPLGENHNEGSAERPLKTIQAAISRAVLGDRIIVRAGTYRESLITSENGSADQPITISGERFGDVVVTNDFATVLDVRHANIIVEKLVLDGQFSNHDVVRVRSTADNLLFRFNRVQNGKKDGIDLGNVAVTVPENFDYLDGVRIEDSRFQNFLAKSIVGDRIDAHGIVAGGIRDLEITRTSVYMVSGDALQLANGNWDRVTLDEVSFSNGPIDTLLASLTGFPVGVNPGENAIDTKQDSRLPVRSSLAIRNSHFSGWAGDLISNAAALNLKEKVQVTVDSSTLADNDIALRLRGGRDTPNGALVSITNSVMHDNEKALRVEDGISNLELFNNTFGRANGVVIESAGGGIGSGFAAINNLFLRSSLPREFPSDVNAVADASSFINVARSDYRLMPTAEAIDIGVVLPQIAADRVGVPRPQGGGYDIGAFEYIVNVKQAPNSQLLIGILAALLTLLWLSHTRTRHSTKT